MCHQYQPAKLFGSIFYTVKKNNLQRKGKSEVFDMNKTSLDQQRKTHLKDIS